MIDGAVYTPEGKVVLRYKDPMPKVVKIGNRTFVFDCRYGVSLLFADEQDVPSLLLVEGGCCGGRHRVVSLASPVAYSHWQDGLGGR